MTTKQILSILNKSGKPVGLQQLYRYFKALGLKPTVRQRPAQYPPDAAKRILIYLGITPAADRPWNGDWSQTAVTTPPPARIVTLKELKTGRGK
jgi:hypothetical protein